MASSCIRILAARKLELEASGTAFSPLFSRGSNEQKNLQSPAFASERFNCLSNRIPSQIFLQDSSQL